MKLLDNLRADLARIGATLDDSSDDSINLDAPSGYVWRANGCTAYRIQFANSQGQTWIAEALRVEAPALRLGLDKVVDPEVLADHRHELGDDGWGAAPDAPDHIGWPSNRPSSSTK